MPKTNLLCISTNYVDLTIYVILDIGLPWFVYGNIQN